MIGHREKRAVWAAALAAVLAAGSFLLSTGYTVRWIAAAALLFTAPILWKEAVWAWRGRVEPRFPGLGEAAGRYLPYAAVGAGVLMALGPIARGQMPVSQDHANHYFATRILVDEMIPSGRLFGWTDRLGTGYPFGDTYHTAVYLVTAFLHLASLRLVSLQTSYAFGIVIAWLVPALAVTAWTRRIAGPFASAIAGIAFALDMGSDREGGWIYSMFHGVWSQHFGTGVWLLGMLAFFRLAEKRTTRRLAVAILVPGLAVWCHPMNVLNLLLGGALLLLVHLFYARRAGGDPERRFAFSLFAAMAGAGLVGLVWALRMTLAGGTVFAYTGDWEPLDKLMTKLLGGNLFENQFAFLGALSLAGAAVMVRQGGRFRSFTLLMTALLVLAGSMLLLVQTDAGLAGGPLDLIQYRRFSVAAKPLWYAMAGAGFSAVVRGVWSGAAGRAHASLRALGAVLLAPFAIAAVQGAPAVIRSPVAEPLTLNATGDRARLEALGRALQKEAARCAPGRCRAVYWEQKGHGGLYPVIPLADLGYSWQTTLTLPANNFTWMNPTTDLKTLARLGVSIIVSKWEQTDDNLEEVGRFGRHYLYRLHGFSSSRVDIEGPGTARALHWEPERRVVEVRGAGAGTRLTFWMPPYRKWRAYESGKRLATASVKKDDLTLLEVRGVKDGTVLLEYRDTLAERIVGGAGLLLILIAAALAVARPRPLPDWIGPARYETAVDAAAWVLGAAAALGLAALPIAGAVAGRYEWLSGEPRGTRLLSVLHRQSPSHVRISPAEFCVPAYVRNPKFGCSKYDLAPRVVPAARRSGRIPSCLQFGVAPEGRTEISFDLPSGTTDIKGRLHVEKKDGVSSAVWINGKWNDLDTGSGTSPFKIKVQGKASEANFIFSSRTQAKICLEAVALQR